MSSLKSSEFRDEWHDATTIMVTPIRLEFEHEGFKELLGSGGEGVARSGGDAVAQSPLLQQLFLMLFANLLLTMIEVEQRDEIRRA